MLYADELQKFLGAYAGPFGKKPLEMERAEVYLFGDLVQVGLFLEILADVADRFCNAVEIDLFLLVLLLDFTTKIGCKDVG